MKNFLYLVTFILFSNFPASSENKNYELDKLFLKLKKEQNINIASKIENKIWELWITHPTEQNLTDLLAENRVKRLANISS